jgi:hypothetical protein
VVLRKRVSSVVRLIFPGVAERFLRSAQWHKEKYGIMPLFDLFWNFCVNGLFPGQKRVHCQPHTDSKNVVGVCVLVIYQIPGILFTFLLQPALVLIFLPNRKEVQPYQKILVGSLGSRGGC